MGNKQKPWTIYKGVKYVRGLGLVKWSNMSARAKRKLTANYQ